MKEVNTDVLANSLILDRAKVRREQFNPKSRVHRASLKNFLNTGNWGEIQFYPEAPYVSVPETVLRKMSSFAVSK